LIDRVTARLAGEPFEIVDRLSFDHAWQRRAHTLIRVESIPRPGVSPPEPASLAPLVQAAEAPSVSRVIVVTTRVDTDAELRRLRRSGARYVIVRPPHVVDVEALRGKRVLVPRTTADTPFVTVDALVEAVIAAVRDPSLMGVTIDVPPSDFAALETIGVKPRIVAPWRARVGRWLRQPVLDDAAARA
jgi:hypothetical protein